MNYRTLTISREFGSGGGRIAKIVADGLGWKLLDRELIEEIARSARVDPRVVTQFDERSESWVGRMNRRAMRGAALAAGVSPDEENCFDCDVMADLTQRVIERAHKKGDCVIVGRGAQCILQQETGAFHVFIYAPFHERAARLKARLDAGADVEQRIHAVDGERAHYLKQFFGKLWNDPHLYDLMISSSENEEATADVIVAAMKASDVRKPEKTEQAPIH